MSILYQALRRREQLESKGDTRLRPSVSTAPSAPRDGGWSTGGRWLLLVLIVGGIGMVAQHYLTMPTPVAIDADTAVAEAPIPTPGLIPPSLAPPAAPSDTVTLGTVNPVDLQSIADVAAMLPSSAQQPLPTPQVKVESGPSPVALSKRAMALQAQGASDAAIVMYDKAGNDFHNQVNRWGLVAASDPERAVAPLRGLVNQRPDDAAARAQLGIALVKTNKPQQARRELERAAALAPANAPGAAQVWYNLAILYDQSGERPTAIIAYEKALAGAMATGQQDSIDTTAIQRRLNYLRATPAGN